MGGKDRAGQGASCAPEGRWALAVLLGVSGAGWGVHWGHFKGHALRVDTEQHQSTRHKFNLTRLVFAVPALPRTVVMEPDGRFSGSPIRQEHLTPAVTALLKHPSVRERFSVAANTYRELVIQDGHIRAQRDGRVLVTVEELESFIEPAWQLARALDEAARSDAATRRSG